MDENKDLLNEQQIDEQNASVENEQTEQQLTSSNKALDFFAKIGAGVRAVGRTLWRWTKRMFMGASKELTEAQKFDVEAIESPLKQTVKSFFRKPLAVIALAIVVIMFLFVIIGPMCNELDLGYEENYHTNLAPGYNFMKVPTKLAKNVKSISSFSFYSIGVDNDGGLYVWGNTRIPISANDVDFKVLPEGLKDTKVAFAEAGYDHAIAITEQGKVIGWGEYDCGQYGTEGSLAGTSQVMTMPDELLRGTIDVNQVAQLTCGYQVSAIVMKDGSCYVWGNYRSGASNMRQLRSRKDIAKIVFLGTQCAALLKDGTLWFGNAAAAFDAIEQVNSEGKTEIINLVDYIGDRKVVDIASTKGALGILLDDGNVVVTGIISSSNKVIPQPTLGQDEKIVQIVGGAKHFTMLSTKGKVYSFGENALGQCNAPSKTYSTDVILIAGAFQNYIVSANNKVMAKWGCKGYVMGTDNLGRDVFTRIMHGGKQTMTMGAVAVIISTVIAIIIGCLSGYFGGWVDMLLMRVTEIFSAIPFLPFALILSAILAGSNLHEDTRIFMIMVILGVLSWTGLAHMIRGQVLAEREKEFVLAAKAMGVKESRIAFRHILPNVMSVILVSVTLDFAGCMLTESSLSYLGFGVKLPRPTWGNMLNGCTSELVIGNFWWRWLFPALFLLITTICINIIGDALRDIMDPKSSSER